MQLIDKDYVSDILGELLLKYPNLSKQEKVLFGIAFQEAIQLILNHQIK